mgnify:CR=1 FL=1
MRVRGSRSPLILVAVVGLLAAASPSHAQRSGGPVDIQLFRPAIDSKGLITLNASQVLGHLDLSFGLVVNYARNPFAIGKQISLGGGLQSIYAVEHMATGNLQAAIGLFKYVEFGIGLPLTFWSGDSDPDRKADANNPDRGGIDAQGAGDLAFHLKGRILNTSKHPVGLAVMASVTVPTGGKDSFLGEGRVTVTPTVIVDKDFFRGRLRLAANVGARLRFGNDDTWNDTRTCTPLTGGDVQCGSGMVLQTKHRLQYGVGVAFGVVPQRFDIVAEFIGQMGFGGSSDVDRMAHEVLAGLRLYLARNSYMMLGAGRGLRGGWGSTNYSYGSPDIRGFLGFVFEPNIGDRDGDGIKDDVDKCPTQPEDFDDFEDEDGCPDEDNDKDGILDEDDKCPNDPEDKDGIEDTDGCPEADVLDRDGDGIPDNKDKCPDDPEDKDNFEDKDGCPDPDNDKDGILDVDDLCPNKPEDKDGFEDKDGCPDPDNDKDRILDVDDKCPNEPETYNGYQDEDGCPDKGRVVVHKGRIEILDKIYFETNKAVIKPVSFPILNAIAATLKGNPQILQIEIQGHADERGSDVHNLKLTDARAKSVRRYLVEKGVSVKRLLAKGYGETRPVDKRHNEEAWAKNRRVEFVILKRVQ